jgi:tRNA-splicing ligase RtcB
MNCPVLAFLTPDLFEGTNEGLWKQAAQSASYEGVTDVFLMPDTHLGYGVPIGGVVRTENTLIQAGSGYDISCGVLSLKTDIHASEIVDKTRRVSWVQEVESRVATGLGSHCPPLMVPRSYETVREIFRSGAASLGTNPDLCERLFIPIDEDHFKEGLIEKATRKAAPQLGSLGGGNHFIEMQVDPTDSSVWLMIHCGSRGYGWQTANYFYYEAARLRGLRSKRREESWLRMDERLGQEYWAHHNTAANYAIANRHIIAGAVREATEVVFGKTAQVFYEISHNLIQEETIALDGTRGLVHRKGATRALPPGHPDLRGTKWADTGHPCLIPGSMLHGAAILYPTEGARTSGYSINHGAGRCLGRGDAKRELQPLQDEIDEEMRTARVECADGTVVEGIVMNTERTPLVECGHAYKDLDVVLDILETEGIAKIERRMYPVANLKGLT